MQAEPLVTDPMLPVLHRVAHRRFETRDTVTLTLEPVDEALPAPAPGQFMMLYAFGVGEVPISVSAPPLVHTVRAVGAVSAAVHRRQTGDVIGVRGPFGTGWDIGSAEGGDLVVVGGGIGFAPLRAAVLAALAERERFRRVVLLVGARSPGELLFADQVREWSGRGDVDVLVTVDRADAGWRGHVGVVGKLVDSAPFDPQSTTALVCGPEIMMRLTAEALVARGVPPSRVRLSLERNMKCGVGLCGHCQYGPLFVCRDGPVVGYDRVAPLLAVREL